MKKIIMEVNVVEDPHITTAYLELMDGGIDLLGEKLLHCVGKKVKVTIEAVE